MNLTDTSAAAYDAIKPHCARLQSDILSALALFPLGLTTVEITELVGESYETVQPRTSELRQAGLLCDSGKRGVNPKTGKTVIVWSKC